MFQVSSHGPLTRIRCARSILGRVPHEVSCYQLGDTLVDSGCPVIAARLAKWCRDRGVRRIVHTHHHEDHTGGDAALTAMGLEILAPARTVPILADFYRLPLYRRIVWGRAQSACARPMGASVRVGDHHFEVVPTPGHAADHVCLFERDLGWVFTGDLFIAPRVVYLRPVEDAHEILRSLRTIRDLNPRRLICSHAGVVEDASGALDHRIRFWEELEAAAREGLRRGESERAVTRRLLGRDGMMALISCGDFAKLNLVRSLVRPDGTK